MYKKIFTIPVVAALFSICSASALVAQGHTFCSGCQDATSSLDKHLKAESYEMRLNLPKNLPESFSLKLSLPDGIVTLTLEKNHIFGKNTRCLIDDGTGSLKEVDLGPECTYLGRVLEEPEFTVSAVLTEKGLMAQIIRPGQDSISIEPLDSKNRQQHKVTINETIADAAAGRGEMIPETAASTTAINASAPAVARAANAIAKSSATQRPTRVMDVLEYEIGVEIGSRAFFANTAYKGDLSVAQAVAQGIPGNLDARYLRAAGVKHRLGTVIIRTNAATDPLRDRVTATGGGTNANSSLANFRDYWNANPQEVGDTHDLAVYHVLSNPSGLAYVNSVGSRNRYATSGGNGATSWANGTLVHEFGHSWNLRHVSDNPIQRYEPSSSRPPQSYYESKPRRPQGSDTAGGDHIFISVMDGDGRRNIGRMATDEANEVYKQRQQRRRLGNAVTNLPNIPPFGHRDEIVNPGKNSVVIDVVRNDFDANNDVLDAALMDTVSNAGGKISLSAGTGPGRRNEIIYTPPAGFEGVDFFHYFVYDDKGRRDWAAVYVVNERSSAPLTVDLSKTNYDYDFGSFNSPVQTGWTAITPNTTGDINWSGDSAVSRDRGTTAGNNINRDFIQGSGTSRFNHRISNGTWNVTLNMGDALFEHDRMGVRAEGQLISNNITSPRGRFSYVNTSGANAAPTNFTVTVRDGELNMEFFDNGGSDPNWVLNRLSLRKVANTSNNGGNSGNNNGNSSGNGNNAGSGSGSSFRNVTRNIPGFIQAEDFNNGGAGIGYRDSDVRNNGNSRYRNGERVDIANGNTVDSARFIGWIANGEYWNYAVNVTPATYNIRVRVASAATNPGDLRVELDGNDLGVFPVTSTGGWRNFRILTLNNVRVTSRGLKNLRLTAVNGGSFNFDWIRFNPATSASVGSPQTVNIRPNDDVFLQNGIRKTDNILRVQSGATVRESYLKFNIMGVSGNVTNATLKLAVTADPGNGTIRVYRGAGNSWTETNLSSSNAPAKARLLGETSGNFALGDIININLNGITGNGVVSLIVTQNAGGNDVAFSAKEGLTAPQLQITSQP